MSRALRLGVAALVIAGAAVALSQIPRLERRVARPPAAAAESGAQAQPADPAQAYYQQAFAAGERHDFATAAAYFQRLREAYPRSELADDAMYQQAICSYAQGQWEQALAEFERVRQNYPDSYLAVRAEGWEGRVRAKLAPPASPASRAAAPARPPAPAPQPVQTAPPGGLAPLLYENTTAPVLPLCGPRALELVCQQYGRPAEVEELARLAGTDRAGTSLAGLAQAAEAKGLSAQGLQVNLTQLERLPKPLIAWVGGQHYVVVTGCSRQQVQLVDPDRGAMTLSPPEFSRQWQGYVLAVQAAPFSAPES